MGRDFGRGSEKDKTGDPKRQNRPSDPKDSSNSQPERVTVSFSFPTFPPGMTIEICRVGNLLVTCTEGVLRSMLYHSQQGLPKHEGGGMDTSAVEVTGSLLGRIKTDGENIVLAIEQIVPFPIEPENREDRAVYTAEHAQMVERALRRYDGLQEIGDFHSHPGYDLVLSQTDLLHFRERKDFNYFVAVVVRPRPDPQYGNKLVAGFFIKYGDHDFKANTPPDGYVTYDARGNPEPVSLREARPKGTFAQQLKRLLTPQRAALVGVGLAAVIAAAVFIGRQNRKWTYSLPPLSGGAIDFSIPSPNTKKDWTGEIIFQAFEGNGECGSDTTEFKILKGEKKWKRVVSTSGLSLIEPWSRLNVLVRMASPRDNRVYSCNRTYERKHGNEDPKINITSSKTPYFVSITVGAPDGAVEDAHYVIKEIGSGRIVARGRIPEKGESAEIRLAYNTNYTFIVDYYDAYDLVRLEMQRTFTSSDLAVVAESRPPSKPVNLRPKMGSEPVDLPVTLSWEQSFDPDGGRVTYEVFLDKKRLRDDLKGSKSIVNVNQTYITLGDLEPKTRYYWRVVAVDDEGQKTPSDVFEFTTAAEKLTKGEEPPARTGTVEPKAPAEPAKVVTSSYTEQALTEMTKRGFKTDADLLKELQIRHFRDLPYRRMLLLCKPYNVHKSWGLIAKDCAGNRYGQIAWYYVANPPGKNDPHFWLVFAFREEASPESVAKWLDGIQSVQDNVDCSTNKVWPVYFVEDSSKMSLEEMAPTDLYRRKCRR